MSHKVPQPEDGSGVKVVGRDATKKKKATCARCGAKLEFYQKDVQTRHLSSMGESDGSYDYVRCPDCNAEVVVR